MMSVRSNCPVLRALMRKYDDSALGDVDEGSVGEHGGVQRRVEVVRQRNHAAEIALDELRVVLDGMGERAEDHADRRELLPEGGADRDRVEHGVDRDAGEPRSLVQRDVQLLVGFEQLGIDLGEILRAVGKRLRRRVVGQRLEVDRFDPQLRPVGMRHRHPLLQGGEPALEQELRLALAPGYLADRGLVEARRQRVRIDLRHEAVRIRSRQGLRDGGVVVGCRHGCQVLVKSITISPGSRLR